MRRVAQFIVVLLLAMAGAPALAADAAEISFWESVRDSRNPAELQAYLDQYPQGTFAVLAKARLATLASGSRQQAPAATPALPASSGPPKAAAVPLPAVPWTMPSAGDTWTYSLREPKRTAGFRAGSAERTLVVTVASASAGEVLDRAAIDGAAPLEARHLKGGHLLAQGAAVFSPYLQLLGNMPAAGSIGRIQNVDPACAGRYICDAKGRIAGRETVRVPAGTFEATKIVIEQSWRSSGATAFGGSGGRTLTIWYAPHAKRAVKYSSRTAFGQYPPIEPDFELELLSYKVE